MAISDKRCTRKRKACCIGQCFKNIIAQVRTLVSVRFVNHQYNTRRVIHSKTGAAFNNAFNVIKKCGNSALQLFNLGITQVVFANKRVSFQHTACGGIFETTHAHCRLSCISLGIDNFAGGLTGKGEVKLVLHMGVELAGSLGFRIVVYAALGKYVGNLLVDAALTGADRANALQQFLELILIEIAAIFQPLIIKAFNDVFLD